MVSHDSNLTQFKDLISQSIMINYEMLKLPKRDKNYDVTLNYNIIDFYKSVLVGKKRNFKKVNLIIKLREKVKRGLQA